jgi:hypothetical protein
MKVILPHIRKPKRAVTYDGSTYKVRSDTIELPNFDEMERFQALQWLGRHTYARGYSKPNPLQGMSFLMK